MYSRAGQVMSLMTSLWNRSYQKVLATKPQPVTYRPVLPRPYEGGSKRGCDSSRGGRDSS